MSQELKRDYQILEEIGRGRYGTVSRCVSGGSSFAVKSIDKASVRGDELESQCLFMEPKILQHVSPHPNIVRLFDLYEDSESLHVVMELCDGPDLHERILAVGPFPEAEAAAIVRQVMQGVAHCHRVGVAHRDLKPDNIMFDEEGRVKIGDFGSAEVYEDGGLMSGVVGTPYYVAPEVVAGRLYSEKVDVWSVGVILYIMLAGFPPFYGESAVEIFQAVLRANLRFPTRAFRSVSPAAKDLLRRMLCKDVSRRFSAEQVLNAEVASENRDIHGSQAVGSSEVVLSCSVLCIEERR